MMNVVVVILNYIAMSRPASCPHNIFVQDDP